jgi:hypothetical protein
MNKNTNQKKRPTHAIYQVIGEGQQGRWIRVGAAFANKDGKGWLLKFDAYPVVGRTQMRELNEQESREADRDQQ